MANFSFLLEEPNYEMFAQACVEAEEVLSVSPTIGALSSRRAFELAVKWVFDADTDVTPPYKDNLQSLVHEPTFCRAVGDRQLLSAVQYIIKAGNMAAHRNARLKPEDAMFSLQVLFDFVQWLDRSYGAHFQPRTFDPQLVPAVRVALTIKALKAKEDAARREYEAQMGEKTTRIESLERRIRELSEQLTARKATRSAQSVQLIDKDLNEFETRKRFIDLDLRMVGWDMDRDVAVEYPVYGMEGNPGQRGFADYVLKGRDGRPLAVIEAKRTTRDPQEGLQQARLYADCLESQFGYKPLIFLTNGYRTYFVDDAQGPYRPVGEVFAQDDLQRIMDRRTKAIDPLTVPINQSIAGGNGRYYQIEAIHAVCDNLNQGQRRSLLVMATGTGKTRVSAALADVLMRAGLVKNVLFLADRVELVNQAASGYGEYFPEWSLCNLCDNKRDVDARVVFSTYQTMINAIDREVGDDGKPVFSSGHFDLIIVDEAHRSIFNKYRVIFDHFDAIMVGLTATPRNEVDRNTYDFFQVQHGVPTYVYEYETALEDGVLVPYRNIEAKTKFMDEGITYDDLSDEDKERYEDDFGDGEDEGVPEHIEAGAINNYVMNPSTVDTVLRDLHDHGIRADGGQRLGKTVIFAANQMHARFIVERYGALYPKEAANGFIKAVVHGDSYAHSIVKEFKRKTMPVIAVSVDMLDTGVDVPEVVNLVFFKKVRSKIKFWQMIGRGTRLCPELDCVEGDEEYVGKRHFMIFDYCGNFAFFREQTHETDDRPAVSLSERIFARKSELVRALQSAPFADDEEALHLRGELVDDLCGQIGSWKADSVAVRLKREYVERYRHREVFDALGDLDVRNLTRELAPLAQGSDDDVAALRFDALVYGFMVAAASGAPAASYAGKVRRTVARLRDRMTIAAVRDQKDLIMRIAERDDYLPGLPVTELERLRVALRGLVRYVMDEGDRRTIITDLTDPLVSRVEGQPLDSDEHYEDYKLKVNRYVNEHQNEGAIRKLRHNEPLNADDYSELEQIFLNMLGTREEYDASYGHDMPLGLLVRRIAKLDHQAAMDAFADFVNAYPLNQEQIAFVRTVVDYVTNNGYVEPENLTKPPFNRPRSVLQLFSRAQCMTLFLCIKRIKDNALVDAGAAA